MRKEGEEGLANLVSEELKQIVAAAMYELNPRHREVLVLRCYEGMAYSEIAGQMGRSEFATRMLFLRAKKALARKLAYRGLGKGSLLMALVVFGKMTAANEAAAANVSVAAATLKVGTAASLTAMATSKTAIVSLATAGVVAVGSVVIAPSAKKIDIGPEKCQANSAFSAPLQADTDDGNQERMYFYPKGADGSVMMRLMKLDSSGRRSCCRVLQNQNANYHFDDDRNTIFIDDYHIWERDLSVWRLPTDSHLLSEFISKVEGRQDKMEYVSGKGGNGLLVVVKPSGEENGNSLRTTYHYNVLGEDYFKYDWPGGEKLVDNRDAMHRRGWTYFTIKGQINGKEIKGSGRIPFVYAASESHWPWMRLNVGGEEFVDGSFTGFGRPWMGLHTIDAVRRDAAEKRIQFETRLLDGGAKAEVTLTYDKGKLVYTIDMETDVVGRIAISGQGGGGELSFTYLQDIGNTGGAFVEPRDNYVTRGIFEIMEAD